MTIKKLYSIGVDLLEDDISRKSLWARFGSSTGHFVFIDNSVIDGMINKNIKLKFFIEHLKSEKAIVGQQEGLRFTPIDGEILSFLGKWKTSSGVFDMNETSFSTLLQNFLIDSCELTVVDPYFFSVRYPNVHGRQNLLDCQLRRNEIFINAIMKAHSRKKVNRIVIHYKHGFDYNPEVHRNFKSSILNRLPGCEFESYCYQHLHNRYLIDQNMVVVFGNSFQLIGQRKDYFQVFSKPNEIRREFIDERRISINGGQLTSRWL